MKDLDQALLAAHAAEDRGALVSLYQQASAAVRDDPARAAFYLTHAYVFALEMDHPGAAQMRAQLIEMGREVPLPGPRAPLR
jgi:hypothetical protein